MNSVHLIIINFSSLCLGLIDMPSAKLIYQHAQIFACSIQTAVFYWKYGIVTSDEINTKLHPGPEWCIFLCDDDAH